MDLHLEHFSSLQDHSKHFTLFITFMLSYSRPVWSNFDLWYLQVLQGTTICSYIMKWSNQQRVGGLHMLIGYSECEADDNSPLAQWSADVFELMLLQSLLL